MQNVEIIDIESDGSNQSDNNYERVFVKIAQNYRKINEKQKSSGHHEPETSHKSSTNCGYEVKMNNFVVKFDMSVCCGLTINVNIIIIVMSFNSVRIDSDCLWILY
jgi:hypothetical protein